MTLSRVVEPGPKDARDFVELEIDTSRDFKDHKICAIGHGTVQTKGDFTIPVLISDFYK
jgi:hypothetical protein